MADPSPPFSALRTVEAATRHRSFTWAARELNVTHSAVSQSIRRLEAELGTTLFEQRGTAMEPSEAAKRLAQCYSETAQALSDLIRDVSGVRDLGSLKVALAPDFARLWMPSRLSRMKEAMPDIQIQFTSATNGGEPDLEVLFDSKIRPIDQSLAEVTYFPVCSPSLSRGKNFNSPNAILRETLLSDLTGAWKVWIDRYAPQEAVLPPSLFDDTAIMLASAAQGGGVAFSQICLAEPYLASGELQMLPFAAPSDERLLLRSRAGASKAEYAERFALWLRLELARSAALLRRAAT